MKALSIYVFCCIGLLLYTINSYQRELYRWHTILDVSGVQNENTVVSKDLDLCRIYMKPSNTSQLSQLSQLSQFRKIVSISTMVSYPFENIITTKLFYGKNIFTLNQNVILNINSSYIITTRQYFDRFQLYIYLKYVFNLENEELVDIMEEISQLSYARFKIVTKTLNSTEPIFMMGTKKDSNMNSECEIYSISDSLDTLIMSHTLDYFRNIAKFATRVLPCLGIMVIGSLVNVYLMYLVFN